MSLHKVSTLTLFGIFATIFPPVSNSACDANSGPNTAALVELYTSEGCSSCPPADRQLSRIRQLLDPAADVVPLALHVGYWDHIGWKDPYSNAAFDERQSWLARTNRQRTVYTPQFFVGGMTVSSPMDGLRREVQTLNALPAAATIRLQTDSTPGDTVVVNAEATTASTSSPAVLYLAVTESGLVSHVTRGENSGATLAHDHVVRAWFGPFHLANGLARFHRVVQLPSDWSRRRLDVTAFVQDGRSGRVLQALRAKNCLGT